MSLASRIAWLGIHVLRPPFLLFVLVSVKHMRSFGQKKSAPSLFNGMSGRNSRRRSSSWMLWCVTSTVLQLAGLCPIRTTLIGRLRAAAVVLWWGALLVTDL